jgi:hypothetical protein
LKAIRRFFRFPYLPVWLSALILLSPVYLTGKALFWGTPLLQFGPWWSLAWQTLLSGHLPLWNPLVGMGAPLLANYQSGLFYPPYWLYLVLFSIGGSSLMAWGMAPLAAVHLALAGMGMIALTRRLGLKAVAQLVSGLAFGLSGYLVARLGFLSINAATAWLPWILFLLTPIEGAEYPRRRDFPKLVLCLVLILLAGHAQTTWYVILLAVLWTAFWAWTTASNGLDSWDFTTRIKILGRNWLFYFLAIALSAGIAAAQLLPTAEYLIQSQRAAAVEYDYALNYSFWPWHLLTLLAPGLFGSPVSGDYWGYGNIWEDAIYVGLLPLLLAGYALIVSLKRRSTIQSLRRLSWFLGAVFMLSFVLALGKNTPIFPWLYRRIPTFSMFQAPARWIIWAEFALALLAGFGANVWHRPQRWGLYWTRLGTMAAFAIMVGAGLAWFYLGSISPSFIRSMAILGLLGVGAGVLSLTAPPGKVSLDEGHDAPQRNYTIKFGRFVLFSPSPSPMYQNEKPFSIKRWQWSVAIFISLDLLVSGWGLNPGGAADLYQRSPNAQNVHELLQGGVLYIPPDVEEWLKYRRFFRFDSFDPGEDWHNLRAIMLPNTNILDGVPAANNFDPLVPARYAEWMEMLAKAPPGIQAAMMRQMNVRLILRRSQSEPFGVGYSSLEGERLHWFACARSFEVNQIPEKILTGQVDLNEELLLEGEPDLDDEDCPAPGSFSNNQPTPVLESFMDPSNPNRIEIKTHNSSSGWLMVSETWYPGWKAWVDGKSVPLLQANYLFEAIHLEAGNHSIRIAYRPLSFYIGLVISLISIILGAIFFYKVIPHSQ